jgi:hypothetical protein
VSKTEQKVLDRLVQDCQLYRFSEVESIRYIEQRNGGKKISRSNLYKIKKRLIENRDGILSERFSEHMRTDYAAAHVEMLDDLARLREILLPLLAKKTDLPSGDVNLSGISKIAAIMLETIKVRRVLSLDEPFVSGLKKELERLRANQRVPKVALRDLPPSALIIPPDSIAGKPSEAPEDDNDDPVY